MASLISMKALFFLFVLQLPLACCEDNVASAAPKEAEESRDVLVEDVVDEGAGAKDGQTDEELHEEIQQDSGSDIDSDLALLDEAEEEDDFDDLEELDEDGDSDEDDEEEDDDEDEDDEEDGVSHTQHEADLEDPTFMDKLMKTFDKDKDGKLSHKEFVEVDPKPVEPADALEEAFVHADDDKDNMISRTELPKLVQFVEARNKGASQPTPAATSPAEEKATTAATSPPEEKATPGPPSHDGGRGGWPVATSPAEEKVAI